MAHEEEGMSKYGVDETSGINPEVLEKIASKGCPICGEAVSKHGSVLACPTHGTEPFERS